VIGNFLDLSEVFPKKDESSLDHSSKVQGNPLGVEHQDPGFLELPRCVPRRTLEFSSLGAFY
jgi:hypothetical protein